jgi:hypothetical protein
MGSQRLTMTSAAVALERSTGGFPTIVADLIEDRRQARALLALLLAGLLGTAFGPVGWPCPIQAALGIPCPGCGLTRGVLELLAGHGSAALALHPLAPLGLAAALLLTVAALLPAPALARLAGGVRRAEATAALDPIVVGALIVVWLFRLVVLP